MSAQRVARPLLGCDGFILAGCQLPDDTPHKHSSDSVCDRRGPQLPSVEDRRQQDGAVTYPSLCAKARQGGIEIAVRRHGAWQGNRSRDCITIFGPSLWRKLTCLPPRSSAFGIERRRKIRDRFSEDYDSAGRERAEGVAELPRPGRSRGNPDLLPLGGAIAVGRSSVTRKPALPDTKELQMEAIAKEERLQGLHRLAEARRTDPGVGESRQKT